MTSNNFDQIPPLNPTSLNQMKRGARMKWINLLVIALAITACEPSHRPTQRDVDSAIDQWLNLWATYDLDLLDEIFLQSESLTYFSSEKVGLIQGYDQMKPHHEGFGFVSGGKTPEKSLWLSDLETRFYGGSVMVGGIWYFGDKSAPEDRVQKGPVTFVLTQNDKGRLKIAHTHFANY